MNNKIRIARGYTADIQNNTNVIPAGTPFYDLDQHKLYIGDGVTQIKDLPTLNSEHSNTSSLATNCIKSIVDKTTVDPYYYGLELVQSSWEEPNLSFKFNNLFSPQEQRKYYIPITRNILRAPGITNTTLDNIQSIETYYSYNVTGVVQGGFGEGSVSSPHFNNNFNIIVNYDGIKQCHIGSWFSTINYRYNNGSMALYTFQTTAKFILYLYSNKVKVYIDYTDHTNTHQYVDIGTYGTISSICPIPIPSVAQ